MATAIPALGPSTGLSVLSEPTEPMVMLPVVGPSVTSGWTGPGTVLPAMVLPSVVLGWMGQGTALPVTVLPPVVSGCMGHVVRVGPETRPLTRLGHHE